MTRCTVRLDTYCSAKNMESVYRAGRLKHQTCLAIGHDTAIEALQHAQHNVLDIAEDVSLAVVGPIWEAMHLVKREVQAAAILQANP